MLCIICSILELLNGGVCYISGSIIYSGNINKNNSINWLKLKFYGRLIRLLIDSIGFITRLLLWIKYDIIQSAFIIKNLYHIVHIFALYKPLSTIDYTIQNIFHNNSTYLKE